MQPWAHGNGELCEPVEAAIAEIVNRAPHEFAHVAERAFHGQMRLVEWK